MTNIYNTLKKTTEKYKDIYAFRWMDLKDEGHVTYGKFLDDVIEKSCHILEKYSHEKHIGVKASNTYDCIVTIFAIVCLGKCAVMLDPNSEESENNALLEQTDTKVVYYTKPVNPTKGENDLKNSNNDHNEYNTEDIRKITELMENVDGERDAFIIFTSGSTGAKKAVVLSNKSLCFSFDKYKMLKNIAKGSDILVGIPLYHMFGIYIICSNLGGGVTTCIMTSIKYLKKSMEFYKPAVIESVPMLLEFMYANVMKSIKKKKAEKKLRLAIMISNVLRRIGIDLRRKLFKDVRRAIGENLECFICGGAKLDEKVQVFFENIGIHPLVGYGLSEMGGFACINSNENFKIGSIGKTFEDSLVRIKDGEIQVKSESVTRGYYNNSEETEKLFDGNWLKTGDLGYIDNDGFIFLTGRIKNLIILSNGENISPEPLEERLVESEYIEEAIVCEKDGHIHAKIYPGESVYIENDVDKLNIKIKQHIDTINRNNRREMYIETFELKNESFERTNTMKIKRG